MSMLYQNHNYGLNNTGTAQAVSSITEYDVRDFIKSNFAKDNLEVFFTGNISQSDIETYIETLFSKLPDKSESKLNDISSSALSEEKEALIRKNNMENIVGITLGVRLGKLNRQERAAAHMIIESLFDGKIGDFNEGLRSRNIAYGANVRFIRRRLSNVFYFTVYIDEKDLANYKKYLQDKMSSYRDLKLSALNKILSVKKRLTAPSQNGFANIANIEEKMKYYSLPFEEVTREILSSVAQKLFDESQTRIVYIMR
jgi:predicted Zn-dependent peptidase